MVSLDCLLVVAAMVFTAVVAVEHKDSFKSILAFALMSASVGVAMIILGAPVVGFFQMLVYAGAITVLFLAVMHVASGEEHED